MLCSLLFENDLDFLSLILCKHLMLFEDISTEWLRLKTLKIFSGSSFLMDLVFFAIFESINYLIYFLVFDSLSLILKDWDLMDESI